MKLILVLLLPSIVRYCVASDPNSDLPPESDPTWSSISLPEEISSGNPTIATTDAANLQREEPSPDHPLDIGESVEFLSQSKSDSCGSDRIQDPSSRKRFRRQSCLSPSISPDTARKNPVSIPSLPIWGNTGVSTPGTKKAPPLVIIREDRRLCADEWHNMPVCAQESSAKGDYLPSCRPSMWTPLCSASKRQAAIQNRKNLLPILISLKNKQISLLY